MNSVIETTNISTSAELIEKQIIRASDQCILQVLDYSDTRLLQQDFGSAITEFNCMNKNTIHTYKIDFKYS